MKGHKICLNRMCYWA